ncbi:MAG: sulfatase [Cyclobacteriaceae bacterium]|nr:sulfatase [Cyclobacteriaceae bacterium]
MMNFQKLFLTRGSVFLLFILAVASTSPKEQKEETRERPNILFIMTDDHAVRAISCYDGSINQTPNLDRIAKEGVIFKNSFVSNSICAPSRAVMLTGKHSHFNGQIDNSVAFDGSQQTFPKLLQQAGYQTALVGKWHLRSDPTGFDYWNILPGQGQYYNPDFIEMGEQKRIEGYATTVTTDLGLNWLDGRDMTKPFCLLLHHKAPHRTWQPDTSYLDDFANKNFPVPDNFFDKFEGRQAAAEQKLSIRTGDMDLSYDLKIEADEAKSRFPNYQHKVRMNEAQKAAWKKHYDPIIQDYIDKMPEGDELDLYKYQRYMRDYIACIQSVDDNVGRVLDYLEENGLSENTLVVYTSDQGFYTGEHGWFDKRFIYEQSLRTPLLMKAPKGYNKKGEINELVQNIDYAATFLDIAGVAIPEDMQGISLKPLLQETTEVDLRESIYYHYYEFPNEHAVKRHVGIRTDRYKLIHFYNDIDDWELYDLQTDSDEMNNIYEDDSNATLISDLKVQLAVLQNKYQDTDQSTY